MHLLCENSDLKSVQLHAFLAEANDNINLKCSDVPHMNLELWAEKLANE